MEGYSMLYIITGAKGHLGNNLVRLIKSRGHDVRAFDLKGKNDTILENLGCVIYHGDITDIKTIEPLFDLTGTNYHMNDVVLIHAAGIVSIATKKPAQLDKVNILGTKNILDLALEKGVRQFIYISSVHAIPEPNIDMIITETNDFDPDKVKGHYAKSKSIASLMVYEKYEAGYPVTIIHPSGIIGPFDFGKGHMTQVIEKYLNKKLSSRINGKYDFVDVRDVAEGIYLASIGKHLGCFILSGENIDLKRMFGTLKEVSGRKRSTMVFARWFVRLFAPMIEFFDKRNKKPLIFTRYSIDTLNSHGTFSHEKASKTFGYNPRPFEVTILDTANWLADQKRITNKNIMQHIKTLFKKKENSK